MKILAHRGCWDNKIKKNSITALRTALEKGFGFESDVRDYMQRLVISHNIADSDSYDAEIVFKMLRERNDQFCFAINIKADGLKDLLYKYLGTYQISNYFLFDMSIPQMIEFHDMGLKFYTRQSEIEPVPNMYEEAIGIWMDCFGNNDWITKEILLNHIENGKEVCIVSPELHAKKDFKKLWRKLKSYNISTDKMIICTDYPDEAKEYFYA